METLVKAYNICVTMVAQGHRHQLSIPRRVELQASSFGSQPSCRNVCITLNVELDYMFSS